MPHLSGSGAELSTVILTTTVDPGSEASVQIDAQEDRKIVAVDKSINGVNTGAELDGQMEVHVGTDPEPGTDSSEDLGGKFYQRGNFTVDGVNGFALDMIGGGPSLQDEHSWDWNEDVTLTLDAEERASSGDDYIAQATIYYVEA